MRSDVELLRIFSAFGIVWFHSGYDLGREIVYSGLIVFLILSAYFAVRSNRKYSLWDRASRLLLPCAFWSAAYAAFSVIRGEDIFPHGYSVLSSILSTPAIHLWYLPFVFLCMIVIDFLKDRIDSLVLATCATLVASALLLSSSIWRQWSYMSPLAQYIHAAPAISIGVLLGSGRRLNQTLRYALVGMAVMSAIFIFQQHIKDVGVTYFVGIVVALILLQEKSILPGNSVILELSKLTFGVYLIHPMILYLLGYVGIGSLSLIALGFTLSGVCIYLFQKIVPRQFSKYVV